MPRRWTKEENEALALNARLFGPDWERVADKMGRTYAQIQQRVSKGPLHVRHAVDESLTAYHTAQDAMTEVPVDHPEILRLERELQAARSETREVERKLRATNKTESLFQQLAGVVRETSMPLPAVQHSYIAPAKASSAAEGATSCDMVLILADEHADEVVSREATWGIEQYDFNIFRCRLTRLRDMIRDYATTHLPRHSFERLWVFKLGDAVNGDIHGHGPLNHFGNTLKAALAVGDAEAQFVQTLLPYFSGGVHTVGISGNHPRRNNNTKKDYEGPLDNFDFLVGSQMATRLANDIAAGRCSVILPESWSAYVEVRNTLWGLNHGDDTTSYTGLPWVGFDRRNNRIQSLLARVERRADAFCYGHYHTPASFPSAGAVSFHSGCWTAADPYAINRLATGGEPQQHLIVVGDKSGTRGILLPIPIYTRHEATEEAYRKGEYEPELGRSTILDTVEPKPSEGLNVVSR